MRESVKILQKSKTLKKHCNYVDKKTSRVCNSSAVSDNGYCNSHGGFSQKTKTILSKNRWALRERIDNIRKGFKIGGQTFEKRLESFAKDPDVYDMNRDIARVVVLVDLIVEQFDVFGLNEKLIEESVEKVVSVLEGCNLKVDEELVVKLTDLFMQIIPKDIGSDEFMKVADLLARLADTSSKMKERVFRVKSGYFDIHAMKYVLLQIQTGLKTCRDRLAKEILDSKSAVKAVKILDEAISQQQQVKVPVAYD